MKVCLFISGYVASVGEIMEDVGSEGDGDF